MKPSHHPVQCFYFGPRCQLRISCHVDNIYSLAGAWYEKFGLSFSKNKTSILGAARGNNNSLISLPRDGSTGSEECCSDQNIESCVTAAVNPDTFLSRGNISILITDLVFHSTVNPNGQVYKNAEGDEAVITYNDQTGNMFGTFKTHQDKSYALEPCGSGHVWKEFNVSSFGQEEVVNVTSHGMGDSWRFMNNFFPDNPDNVTSYEYSVMFYVG